MESYRFFIVGSPRSGTTLLQSLIASHSEIHSFPETHFFSKFLRIYFSKKRFIPFYSSINLNKILKKQEVGFTLRHRIFFEDVAEKFLKKLDDETQAIGKNYWVEKTPMHLHYIKKISSFDPTVKFIHIVRNSKDTVSSIYEATNKYPELWGGHARSIEECVDRWNKDIKITQNYLNDPEHHYVLKYEELVDDPKSTLENLFLWLKLPFEESILIDFAKNSKGLIKSIEPWKANNAKVSIKNRSKFETILSNDQQDYVLRNKINNSFYP